jgi:hypothetical protein
MQRKIIIALGILSFVLAVLCGVLAFKLSNRTRFSPMSDRALYYMFDQKTAQACWAGPPSEVKIELPKGTQPSSDPFLKGLSKAELPTNNYAGIPFCKDL